MRNRLVMLAVLAAAAAVVPVSASPCGVPADQDAAWVSLGVPGYSTVGAAVGGTYLQADIDTATMTVRVHGAEATTGVAGSAGVVNGAPHHCIG